MPNVTVNTPQTIKVQIGNQFAPTVRNLSYGTKTLKSATDLTYAGAQTGDVITYNAANNTFYVTNVANDLLDIDAGFF
jgi:hypothetical protein